MEIIEADEKGLSLVLGVFRRFAMEGWNVGALGALGAAPGRLGILGAAPPGGLGALMAGGLGTGREVVSGSDRYDAFWFAGESGRQLEIAE